MPWSWNSDANQWYNTDTGATSNNPPDQPPGQTVATTQDPATGAQVQPTNPAAAASAGPPGSSGPTPQPQLPYATMTPGFNGNAFSSGEPSVFGTGMFQPRQFPINDQAITGAPTAGAATNYGLNDVWSRLSGAVGGLRPQNYAATAPQATAAQGFAAQGTAAQAAAAQARASGYNAATGSASGIGQVQGAATLAGPTAISTAGDAQWQSGQRQLANLLGATAMGQGVSPAAIQLRQGMDQSLAAQLAALGSQRGATNTALAQRSVADQAAAGQANLNQQLAVQRAQETLNAQNSLGALLGTARGQSQNYNVSQANLLQQLGLANAGFANNMTAQNLGLAQGANEFNAANSQGMTLANLAAMNTARQYDASNSQSMTLADMLARNQMTSENLAARNQFGLANLQNAQATATQNLGNAEQTTLADLAQRGQYGLANQGAAITAQDQYNRQLMALLGGMTGIGEANRAAGLADQQLQVQQNTAANQVGAEAFASAAGNNANLTGSIIGAVGAGGSALLQGLISQAQSTGQPINFTGSDGTQYVATADGVYPAEGYGPASSYLGTGGGGDTGSYALSQPLAPGRVQLSDENVKTGIQGGNPMMRSFLEQVRDFDEKNPDKIDVQSGLQFHDPRYLRTTVGGGGAGGDKMAQQLGAVAAGAVGAAVAGPVGGAVGGFLGGWLGGQGAGAPPPAQTVNNMVSPGGGIQPIGVSDEDTEAFSGSDTMSDDQAKENVISGNRGMQAFLQQANAQQQANASQGAQNNAFMQTGQAPRAQPDRQMPMMFDPNQGYGDSYYSGIFGGGMLSPGGYWGAGISNPGSNWNAALTGLGGITQGSELTNPGGVSNFGSVSNPAAVGTPGLPPFATAPSLPAQRPPLLGQADTTRAGYLTSAVPVNPQTGAPLQPSGGMQAASNGPGFRPALSDEREKTGVTSNPGDLQDFLDALHAHQYRYKDPDAPGAGRGTFVSPMAQEIASTDLGRSAVHPGEDGMLRVDYGKLAGTQLAASAYLNERMNRLERILSGTSQGSPMAG